MNTAKERLLCYFPGPMGWAGALNQVCEEMNIQLLPVSSGQGGQTIAALLGSPGSGGKAVLPLPPEPVMVLCGFTMDRMERFLDRLRESGVPPMLKAMVTPTNLGWTFSALAQELARERSSINP